MIVIEKSEHRQTLGGPSNTSASQARLGSVREHLEYLFTTIKAGTGFSQSSHVGNTESTEDVKAAFHSLSSQSSADRKMKLLTTDVIGSVILRTLTGPEPPAKPGNPTGIEIPSLHAFYAEQTK